MTETTETDPRAWVRYDPDEDTGEVSLPGYVEALPSIVKPGDVFSVPREQLDELTAGGTSTLFVAAPDHKAKSPNEALTREQLAEKLGDPDLATEPKPELVELADEHDRLYPEPAGADESAGDYVPPYDAAVAEARPGDDEPVATDDNPEGPTS